MESSTIGLELSRTREEGQAIIEYTCFCENISSEVPSQCPNQVQRPYAHVSKYWPAAVFLGSVVLAPHSVHTVQLVPDDKLLSLRCWGHLPSPFSECWVETALPAQCSIGQIVKNLLRGGHRKVDRDKSDNDDAVSTQSVEVFDEQMG